MGDDDVLGGRKLQYYIGLIGANWANKANSDQRLISLLGFIRANI